MQQHINTNGIFTILKVRKSHGSKNKLLEIEEKVKVIPAVKKGEVEITFEPTWTKDMMSEEAKLELGML